MATILRVYMESDEGGREYLDDYDEGDLDELLEEAQAETDEDGIPRRVGIEVVSVSMGNEDDEADNLGEEG
jgi:hypothetical protein